MGAMEEKHLNLIEAAKRGDAVALGNAIASGANVNLRDQSGETALHIVCRLEADKQCVNVDVWGMAQALLDSGLEVDVVSNGYTPLHVASVYGAVRCVHGLIAHGASLRAQQRDGRTPLHLAIQHGRLEAVAALLDAGANLSEYDSEGRTAMHYSVIGGRLDVVRLLVKHGGNVDCCASIGRLTPLHVAVRTGANGVAQCFMELGANVDAKNAHGETPLHSAAIHGNFQIVAALFDHGAEIDARDASEKTAFQRAMRAKHADVALEIVRHSARPDLACRLLRDKSANSVHARGVADLVAAGILDEKTVMARLKRCNGDVPREALTLIEANSLGRMLPANPALASPEKRARIQRGGGVNL